MKRRVSLSIDSSVAGAADQLVAAGAAKNRSAYIEHALRDHLEQLSRERVSVERREAADAEAEASAHDHVSADGDAAS